jgi:hypothetical protein
VQENALYLRTLIYFQKENALYLRTLIYFQKENALYLRTLIYFQKYTINLCYDTRSCLEGHARPLNDSRHHGADEARAVSMAKRGALITMGQTRHMQYEWSNET